MNPKSSVYKTIHELRYLLKLNIEIDAQLDHFPRGRFSCVPLLKPQSPPDCQVP
jgi:hypothetical protein